MKLNKLNELATNATVITEIAKNLHNNRFKFLLKEEELSKYDRTLTLRESCYLAIENLYICRFGGAMLINDSTAKEIIKVNLPYELDCSTLFKVDGADYVRLIFIAAAITQQKFILGNTDLLKLKNELCLIIKHTYEYTNYIQLIEYIESLIQI